MNRQTKLFALAALLTAALPLCGCATSIADMPLATAPSEASSGSKEAGSYLPVNELPPDRDEAAMDPAQRAKIAAELAAARDRQAFATATKNTAAK